MKSAANRMAKHFYVGTKVAYEGRAMTVVGLSSDFMFVVVRDVSGDDHLVDPRKLVGGAK